MRHLEQPRPLDGLFSEAFPVLRLSAINEPLFPNLKSLKLWAVTGKFTPFIPMFPPPRTTTITIAFAKSYELPPAMVASIVTTLPTLCPNLQSIDLQSLPKDPMITRTVSGMLLNSDLDAFRSLKVDSLLAEEVRETIHKLPNLRELSVVIEGDPFLPPLVLPNLTGITIKYDRDSHGCGYSAERHLESWSHLPPHIRNNWRLPWNVREGRTRCIHPEYALAVQSPNVIPMEPKLFISPSIHTTDEPRHRILLR